MDTLLKEADENHLLQKARQDFIRKVYLIVATQLAFTFLFSLITSSSPHFVAFQLLNIWLFYLALILAVVLQLAIFCCGIGRAYPLNFFCLGGFTICESYIVSTIVGIYTQSGQGSLVLSAIAATVFIVAALTFIAYTNCIDLTGMSGIMSAVSMGILVLVILGLFFGGGGLISGLLVLGFGVFLVYDTQLIMGKGAMALSSDEYIIGALIIYVDVISIFLQILSLFSSND